MLLWLCCGFARLLLLFFAVPASSRRAAAQPQPHGTTHSEPQQQQRPHTTVNTHHNRNKREHTTPAKRTPHGQQRATSPARNAARRRSADRGTLRFTSLPLPCRLLVSPRSLLFLPLHLHRCLLLSVAAVVLVRSHFSLTMSRRPKGGMGQQSRPGSAAPPHHAAPPTRPLPTSSLIHAVLAPLPVVAIDSALTLWIRLV